jgi:general secretion pathway protein G
LLEGDAMILRRTPPTSPQRQVEFDLLRAAFTLMEMIVVVAIIVALAGLGGYAYIQTLKTQQKNTAKINVKGLAEAVNRYYTDHNRYPSSLQELLRKDAQGGPYLDSADVLTDPWGQPYQYNPNSVNPDNQEQTPEISTTAPDGTRISNFRIK